ncbi:MAG: hypothetical protein V1740_05375 [Candidatus Woesearchaeota archaeon]
MKIGLFLVLFLVSVPLAYSDLSGGFGINIQVVPSDNSTDNDTDPGSTPDQNNDVSIYYHSYIGSREDSYAFTGEEVSYEIYVTDTADEVMIQVDGIEVACDEKNAPADEGDGIGEEFNHNVDYDRSSMDYYECSFIVDDSYDSRQLIKIIANDKDGDDLETERENYIFNPLLSIGVDNGSVKSIGLNVNVNCGGNSIDIEHDTIILCNGDIIGSVS